MLAWLLLSSFAVAADEAEIALRRRQQQLTVDAARQLIAEVLDIQLEQFAENGLTTLPVYRDVRQMRSNLDQVSHRDMRHIIELLNAAQLATGAQQAASLQQARTTARDVVAVLMAERERLRQRLKVAHLQAQLKQLIGKQQEVRTETRHLHDIARHQRDAATVSALEDQRDAHTLYEQLLESLQTARQWENREGQAAADSLKQLQGKNVENLFVQAESALSLAEIDGAAQHQTEILNHLSSVLERIAAAQGLDQFDRSSTVSRIRDLMTAQRQLVDDTKEVDTSDLSKLDTLSRRQHDIRQQLEELDAPVSGLTAGQLLLQQAQAAAYQAEGKLFEGAREEAMGQQQDVLRNLDELKSLLETAVPAEPSTQIPDNVASQIEQMEQLAGALAELSEQQEQIVEDAATRPSDAQQAQQQVAGKLADQADRDPLPPSVQQSVRHAADQAGQASATMQDHSPQASAARSASAQAVQEALQAARTETSAQLQTAHNQLQRAGTNSMSQASQTAQAQDAATTSPAQPPQSPSTDSPSRSAAQAGTPTLPANSENADPNAVAAHRTVEDGQLSGDDRTIPQGRTAADAPWFARLPPGLREAIRSRGRLPSPRGYEERLRRYFESADQAMGE